MDGVCTMSGGRDREIYDIDDVARRAARLYNRYRSPEALAEVIGVQGDTIMVRFKGSFCRTCGIRDWVEDYVYVLEDLGFEAELVEYIEPDNPDEEYRVGVFRLKGRKQN